MLIPDQDEILRIKREREAQIREQALERDRRLAEAEAALRETELREAARRETERQLAEAAAWDALILPQATKEDLQTHCEMLRNHKLYLSQGIDVPKGLLFYGPPGCGKTETARLLSKISGFAFVSLSSADLKVGFIGQAAVAIQRYFDEARQKAPCIVYIDEIDASCPTRTSGHNSVIDNEVNAQLLQEIDGMKTSDARPVFVFASTNRIDLIDPAILQRFTEHIEIPLPTTDERMQLLDLFIGKIPFETPESIMRIRSPYPPGWEAAAEEDRIGYEWNIANGFMADGSGPLAPMKGHEVNVPMPPPDFVPYEMSKAKAEYWEVVQGEGHVLERLALATAGKSGRELKNMVTKATMVAVKRSYQAESESL